MKKFIYYFLGALVLFNLALLGINTYQSSQKLVPVVLESAVSEPVSSGQETQKTCRVSFTATPEVQSEVKPQNQ